MVSTKVEVDRFDGKGDFSLWRQRMRAILVQMKVVKALDGEKDFPATMTQDEKDEASELAYSTIILHLGDKVLREIAKEKTADKVWLKLESLYMTKLLTNKVHLKGKLFGFKIPEDKDLDECLDEFSKIILDLEDMEIKIDDEDQAIMILNALPPSYHSFVETMKYARESLTFEEVISALKSKQMDAKSSHESGESLMVHGRPFKSGFQKKFNKGKFQKRQGTPQGSKTDMKKLKCYFCHKEGHFRRDFPDRKKQAGGKKQEEGDAAVVDDGYDSADLLVVMDGEANSRWIMDSGCSYHMTPNKSWFQQLEEKK
ncbi:unnamed protein product [Rhodiola kirilowii]